MKTIFAKLTPEEARAYQGPVFAPVMDDCDSVPYGEVMVDIKKNRNPGNHKRFFSFRNTTFEMQNIYDDKEVWRKHVCCKGCHVEEQISHKTGKVGYVIKSIDWDELDELEFKPIFTSVINAFFKWYGEDLTDEQIDSILEY